MSRIASVAVLGAPGHGRTTLIQAIVARQNHLLRSKEPPGRSFSAHAVQTSLREYELLDSHVAHADPFGPLAERATVDLAVLVVDAASGPTPRTRGAARAARWLKVEEPVVFLSKVDQCPNPDSLDRAEYETRRLLAEQGFRADELPVVRGDPASALDSRGQAGAACACVDDLLKILDAQPLRTPDPVSLPFLLAIGDVFRISGKGTVVTGRVERGLVRVGDRVAVVGLNPAPWETVVVGVEQFMKTLPEAPAGTEVGLLIRGAGGQVLTRGQVVAAPGSIRARSEFEARLVTLTAEEGGHGAALHPGSVARFALRTLTLGGTLSFPADIPTCLPGEEATGTISLPVETPVAVHAGQRFLVFDTLPELVGFGEISSPGS